MNRVASSRRLQREAGRDVEVMWLTGRLAPDHKTIADFRKDNGPAIRQARARFVELCRQIGVLAAGTVAIDGSKLKAVNHRDRNFTTGKVKLRIDHLEQSAARYLEEMARTDRQEQTEATLRKVDRLKEKLARVRQAVQRLHGIARRLKDTPDGQISWTDPDARSMATYGTGTGLFGYNVQTAADAETHLIEAMYARMEAAPDITRTRRCTVEHPFGTIKACMGAARFQMRRRKNVRTEMALHVMAYNIKRMINMIGAGPLPSAITA